MNYPFDNDIKKTVADNLDSVHASDDLIAETLKRLQLEGLVSKEDREEDACSSANKRGNVMTKILGLFSLVLLLGTVAVFLTLI